MLASAGRVGTLRGASVQVDSARLGRVALGLVMTTLAVVAATFAVAGFHSNEQIDRLQHQGVPVTVTVTGCLGLLGGSGSNAAGYSCRGSYQLDGQRYHQTLPGNTLYPPGTRIPALAVPDDPALVSPDRVIDAQHATADVYVVPAVSAGVLLLLGVLVLVRRRRRGRTTPAAPVGAEPSGDRAAYVGGV